MLHSLSAASAGSVPLTVRSRLAPMCSATAARRPCGLKSAIQSLYQPATGNVTAPRTRRVPPFPGMQVHERRQPLTDDDQMELLLVIDLQAPRRACRGIRHRYAERPRFSGLRRARQPCPFRAVRHRLRFRRSRIGRLIPVCISMSISMPCPRFAVFVRHVHSAACPCPSSLLMGGMVLERSSGLRGRGPVFRLRLAVHPRPIPTPASSDSVSTMPRLRACFPFIFNSRVLAFRRRECDVDRRFPSAISLF